MNASRQFVVLCAVVQRWLILVVFVVFAGIYAFVVLKDDVNKSEVQMIKELKSMVKTKVSSFAQPDHILVC